MPPTAPRLILITGVTRGLGRALAEWYVGQGHHVLGCGRSRDEIDDLASSFGPPHDISAVDVSDDRAVRRWAERLLSQGRPPDLLVNNAGVINRNARLWEVPADEFNAVIDVNIKGIANVIRHVVPAMVARRTGVIVNLSSGWGRSTSPDVAPYCASKWAVEGLTKALAQELPRGMAAIPLNPGIIDTAMLRSTFGERSSSFADARQWAQRAAPYILGLGSQQNGQSLTAPGG